MKLFLKRAIESRILCFKSQHIDETAAQGYSFKFTVPKLRMRFGKKSGGYAMGFGEKVG